MMQHWSDAISNDKYYSPNLSVNHPSYGLAFPPRISE